MLRRALKHSREVITVDHLPSILEFCDSLRSGLSKLALVTLSEFVLEFELTDKQQKDVARMCLKKVTDTNHFIQASAT